MDAPALPHTADDLADWSVYADHLLTTGDPRGEALALELAMPVAPSPEQLAAFHAKHPRLPASDAQLQFGYQLGHVVALAIRPGRRLKMARTPRFLTPEQGALAHAADLMRTPRFCRLAELTLPISTALDPELRRVFRAIPPSCARLVLQLGHATVELADAIVAAVPPHVVALELSACPADVAQRFFSGRFPVITLGRVDQSEVTAALIAAPGVHARVHHAFEPLHPRLHLGVPESTGFVASPDDAAYDILRRTNAEVTFADEIARVVPRRTVFELQARFGVVPIRSQLARALPEHPYVLFPGNGSLELARIADRWSVRCTLPIAVDGRPIEPGASTPLVDGTRVTLNARTLEFCTTDVEARFRRYCGTDG